MALFIGSATHELVQLAPSSSFATQNEAYAGYLGFPCHRCVDYANAIDSLRIRVELLDVQLLKAEKEKTEAERLARRLLELNEIAIIQGTATDPADQREIELRRSLFQANTDKDCLKIMLDRAWKKIAELSVSGISNSIGENSVKPDFLQDSENLLLDLLEPTEIPDPGRCVKDLSSASAEAVKAEGTESTIQPTDSEEFEVLAQENARLESDSLSENSYIFHFVHKHNDSNESKDEDEIIITVRMSTPFQRAGTNTITGKKCRILS